MALLAQALGTEMPGRIGFPRTDLKVVLDGVELKTALALGSWLAFQSEGDQALVMGDLGLTADQVSPVPRGATLRFLPTMPQNRKLSAAH